MFLVEHLLEALETGKNRLYNWLLGCFYYFIVFILLSFIIHLFYNHTILSMKIIVFICFLYCCNFFKNADLPILFLPFGVSYISTLQYTRLFKMLVELEPIAVAWDRKYLKTVINQCKIVYIDTIFLNMLYRFHKILDNNLLCVLSLCLCFKRNIIKLAIKTYTLQKHYSNMFYYVFVLYILPC